MLDLYEYTLNNNDIDKLLLEDVSNNSIWYRTGIVHLNWVPQQQAKNIIKKYHINKNNPRPGVIKYMKDDNPPLPKDSEEMFKRSTWDLDSLIGETEGQLMHDVYYKAANYVFDNTERKHDILTIMQCSSKKPYYDNHINKNNYYQPYGDFSDFACISNPGIIPIYSSQYYPYRYDEWNIPNEEKLDEIINMTYKYRIVNMCRLIRFVKKMGYKHVIVLINNPYKQWLFNEMYKKNIAGAKEWMHIVTTDNLRDTIVKNHPELAKSGLIGTRTAVMRETRKRYERILRSLLDSDEKNEFNKVTKARDEHLKKQSSTANESIINEDYTIKTSVEYDDFLKKFKADIEDNMKSKDVDKGKNNLYYKSYYWTVLDLLLMALDGDIVEDIDGEYWKLMNKLSKDNNFEKLSDFIFYYKPLMKNDDVSVETIENEAYEMGILRKKPKLKLNQSLFN